MTVAPPAAASDLGRAIAALKTGVGTVSTVMEAPKESKKYPEVTISITKELVTLKEGDAPVEMLVLTKRHISDGKKSGEKKGDVVSHYNYSFDKGYCWYATGGAPVKKPLWKWDPKREVRFIPVSEVEVLLDGLRRYYSGAKLVIDGSGLIL